jgi:hypothetical protein
VAAFDHSGRRPWFEGLERAFWYFGGISEEVLPSNARTLVDDHDRATRVVVFDARFLAFARYWGVPAPGLRTLPGPEQGEGRKGHRVSQAQCHRPGRTFASWAAPAAIEAIEMEGIGCCFIDARKSR